MVGCVLSQLKPSGSSIISCEKGLGFRPPHFSQNVEILGLYPIKLTVACHSVTTEPCHTAT